MSNWSFTHFSKSKGCESSLPIESELTEELFFVGDSLTDPDERVDDGGDQELYLICLLVGRKLGLMYWPWSVTATGLLDCWMLEKVDTGDNADSNNAFCCLSSFLSSSRCLWRSWRKSSSYLCLFLSLSLSSSLLISCCTRKVASMSFWPLARTSPIPLFGRGSTWTTWRYFDQSGSSWLPETVPSSIKSVHELRCWIPYRSTVRDFSRAFRSSTWQVFQSLFWDFSLPLSAPFSRNFWKATSSSLASLSLSTDGWKGCCLPFSYFLVTRYNSPPCSHSWLCTI